MATIDESVSSADLIGFLDIPAIQSILEDFTTLTNMATALLDLNGQVLIATGWGEICTRFHRKNPETCKYCTESDLYLAGHVEPGKYVLYKCKNGLWDVVTPLYINGRHVGNIYSGQFFFDDEELNIGEFQERARRYGFDEDEYLQAVFKVPRISRERMTTLMDFLVKFTQLLSSNAVCNLEQSSTIAEQIVAEATLRSSEARNRALWSAIPDLIFVINGEGIFLDYRAAANTILVVPPEKIIGNSLFNTMPPDVARASLSCIEKALATGELQILEYTLPFPSGLGYFEARLVKMDENAVLCISRDITDRKLAEEKIQTSAKLLHSVISGSPIPQFVIDRDHKVLYWNQALESYSGIKSTEIIGTNHQWRAFYDHERPCLIDLLIDGEIEHIPDFYAGKYDPSANIQGAYEATDFFPHMKENGRWLYFTAAPIHNDQGEIIGGVETLEDITERVQKEVELEHVNQVQSLILNNTAVGIGFVRNRVFEWINPQLPKMLGLPVEQVLGASTRIIYASDEEFVSVGQKAYEALGRGEWFEFEVDTPRSDGTTYKGRIVGNALEVNHPQDGSIWIFEDITKRKEVEEELRRINQIQSLILNNTAVGIAFVSGRLIEWANPRVAEMLGRNPDEVNGASTRIIYSNNEDFEYVGKHAYASLGTGQWFDYESHMQRADGTTFYGRILGKALDPDRPTEGSIWIFEDIDQRKMAEEERDTLRHLMKNIIDSMPSILVAVDTNGRVTQWNLEAVRSTGIESDDAVSQPLKAVLPQYMPHISGLEKALAEHRILQEHRIASTREGETRYSEIMVYPLSANAVVGAVVRIDDVTDKVRLEEMMIQTEKMMSVGGLAAGMAHEINNPLSGILQGIQNIQRRFSAELPRNQQAAAQFGIDLEALRKYLQDRQILAMLKGIQEAGNRASTIVNNMLQFSRHSSSSKEPADLAEIIERTIELAANDYDLKKNYDFRHIKIVRDYEPDLPDAWCISTEIEQVILNLLKNAAHALASSPAPGKSPVINVRTRREGDLAVIEVEDNGPGMNDVVKKRIFEPFFTTKEAGIGTGLGLSVSYFIISENHGGQLLVDSQPGKGARFIVQLPFQESPPFPLA